jgi:hypothetical protein
VVISAPKLLYPPEGTQTPIEQEAGWTPDPVQTFGRREKPFIYAGVGTPDPPARILVAIPASNNPGSVLIVRTCVAYVCYSRTFVRRNVANGYIAFFRSWWLQF